MHHDPDPDYGQSNIGMLKTVATIILLFGIVGAGFLAVNGKSDPLYIVIAVTIFINSLLVYCVVFGLAKMSAGITYLRRKVDELK